MKQAVQLETKLNLDYYPDFFIKEEAINYFQRLLSDTTWQEEYIKMFGRTVTVPRLVAWEGESGLNYKYSGQAHPAYGFSSLVTEIKVAIEATLGSTFNFVLLNYYRNGDDYMGWHQDDEKVLGPMPKIASLSFGEERDLVFRHKDSKSKRCIRLEHGSLLVMKGDLSRWEHTLPKRRKVTAGRINLTFRQIVPKPKLSE